MPVKGRSTCAVPEFSLLETLLRTPDAGISPTPAEERIGRVLGTRQIGNLPHGGYWLLDEHLHRLRESADYFDIPLDLGAVAAALDAPGPARSRGRSTGFSRNSADIPAEAGTHQCQAPHKVRLLINRTGQITTEAEPLGDNYFREPVRLELAAQPVDSADVFLFHKTTHRQVYEAARAGCTAGDDVLLYNQLGQVTETCRADI